MSENKHTPNQSDSQIAKRNSDPITELTHNPAIRRVEFEGKEYYVLADVLAYFAETRQSIRQYYNDLKARLIRDGFEVSVFVRQLKAKAKDGKMRLTDCGDIVTIRRLIMSIPSKKAEPLRMYMAGKPDAVLLHFDYSARHDTEWAADDIHQTLLEANLLHSDPDDDVWSKDRWGNR